MKALMVCGSWDDNGGRASAMMNKIVEGIKLVIKNLSVVNGGEFSDLYLIEENLFEEFDILFWFINAINNEYPPIEFKKNDRKRVLVLMRNGILETNTNEKILERSKKIGADFTVITSVGRGNGLIANGFVFSLFDAAGQELLSKEKYLYVFGRTLAKFCKDQLFTNNPNNKEDKPFRVCWNDGSEEILYGKNKDNALHNNGYTLDDYSNIDWIGPANENEIHQGLA